MPSARNSSNFCKRIFSSELYSVMLIPPAGIALGAEWMGKVGMEGQTKTPRSCTGARGKIYAPASSRPSGF